jgi:hypothetical protein
MKGLYETDFHEWSLRNAELLRTGRVHEADLEHIAEELEGLSVSERRELSSRLLVLIQHLLKWSLKEEEHSRSWRSTINSQRREIERLLKDSPSLRRLLPGFVCNVYADAVEAAVEEMLLLKNPFPAECPFSAEQMLSRDFFPAGVR